MTDHNGIKLRRIFDSDCFAVVGASSNPEKFGYKGGHKPNRVLDLTSQVIDVY